ncbi:response regulator [Bacillus sp. FJAT-50079]|uniref:response regulator transcription factor n=1 Tax=Bacillus sp. FJAT-50079 TaxID=2833577 RepID=UPI0020164D6E|nr:response regulator [Bacillus sp. FJAT-50079]
MLIVDDDWLISDSLRSMDEWVENNVDVVGTASNGEEALYWLEKENLDLILTDIRMPHMDGISLTKHIYEHNPSINVIIMSGYEDFSYAHKAIKYNAKGYILKPIDVSELFEVVNRLQNNVSEEPSQEEATSYQDRMVISAKSYIRTNYMKAITLSDVAKRVHLTEHYFGQVFKSVSGETFMSYLTRVRLEKACQLLKNPTLKNYEVSELIGYTDSKYFAKTFQKRYGMTPKEYRSQL